MRGKERFVEAVCKTGKVQEKPKKEGNCYERLRMTDVYIVLIALEEFYKFLLLLVLRVHEDLLLCIVV